MTPEPSTDDPGRTFCDLVMKGGITSGVVYPSAIAGLSRRYRLRNIGGASAGAIAAGAAAAAEHRRQKHGSDQGFRRLEGLAAELGRPPDQDRRGRSLLFHLFAPTRLSRPLFDVLASMLNRQSPGARLGLGLLALVRAFPLTFVVGAAALVAGLVALTRGVPLLPALVAGLGLVAAIGAAVLAVTVGRALRHLALVMSRQDFGLCTGLQEEPGATPALTEWLHAVLQDLAGEPLERPLTFGDLRRIRFPETQGQDGIVLRMMTTCLSLGRPYTLPIRERLYFDPAEWARYFPAPVVGWMVAQSWRQRSKEDQQADALAAAHRRDGQARPLHPIPEPDDFPVLAGVRLSLSFPLLLSAIPLYRHSPLREEGGGVSFGLERLLFTDGGVCSNLPIHLFDAPMPSWPTFALNLQDDLPPGSPDDQRVVRPDRGRAYQADRYLVSGAPTLAAVGSFLGAIVKTMQNWHDMLQRAAPGARERVFTVRHTAKEGGLNLDMPREAIEAMARSGSLAALAIEESFLPPPGTPPRDDEWAYHRWVRLRLLLPVLRDFLGELAGATKADGGPSSAQGLLTAVPPPMGRSYELNQPSRAASWELLRGLGEASAELSGADPDLDRTAPRPEGELRVVPTF